MQRRNHRAIPGKAGPYQLAPYQTTFKEYLNDVIIVCLHRRMEKRKVRLTFADPQSERNWDRFARAFESLAPASQTDKLAWAKRKTRILLDKLRDQPLEEYAWYSHVPGYPPILLLDQSCPDGFVSLEAAVLQCHMAQVAEAGVLKLPEWVTTAYPLQ